MSDYNLITRNLQEVVGREELLKKIENEEEIKVLHITFG